MPPPEKIRFLALQRTDHGGWFLARVCLETFKTAKPYLFHAEERSISAESPACSRALSFFSTEILRLRAQNDTAWRERTQLLRLEDDLFAVVELVFEDVVAVRSLFQRQGVSNDERWIDSPVLDVLQQWLHVALNMALTGLDR